MLDLRTASISSTFGSWEQWRKDAGLLWHNADDMPCPLQTPILAPDDGKVVYSGYGFSLGTLGYYTVFDGGSYGLLMAHQDQAYPQLIGDVKRGDVIGFSGNTGWTTGPHTHVICSVKRFSNGFFDFSREGGGTVSSRLMLTGGYTDGRAFDEMSLQSHTEPGVWAEVTTRVTSRGEWETLDYQGINSVWIQVAGQWVSLSPANPPWANTMFPGTLYAQSAVYINRE